MSIIPTYQVDGGSFDPEEIVDIVPEQTASNNAIQASEERYLSQIIQNNEAEYRKTERTLDQLGNLSQTMLGIAQERKDKHRADREAVIAFDMLTKGIDPELEEVFRGERDLLFDDSLKTEEFARKLEKETGDSITAQEFRDMAGWEKYALAEAWLRDQAKDYEKYFLEAYDSTEVYVDRDGVQTKITQDNIQTPAEQAALDEKIKFNYARRFAGLNESLIATVLKPEIDKYDEKRRNKQALQREKAYQVQIGESDKRFIETSFITANPADGFDNANKFAQRFAAREGTSIGVGRLAFADYLVGLVGENEITYPEAMSILNHEVQARDGSLKSMTSWREWEDLPERLSEAAALGTQAKEEQREEMIAGDLQVIREYGDLTNDEKQQLSEIYKQKYDGYVPVDLQGALAGHEEDWAAEERLENTLRHQGYLEDYQLANVSNEVYNKYADKVVSNSALTSGTGNAKLAQQYITAATNLGTGLELGETEGKPATWLNLHGYMTDLFNQTYRDTLYDDEGNQIATTKAAFDAAVQAINTAARDERTVNLQMEGDYDPKSNREEWSNVVRGVDFGKGGQWKFIKLPATINDQKTLILWSKAPNPISSHLPEYYINVARQLGISPYDLAQRQLSILTEDESELKDREADEIENKPNRSRLLYHYPTRSRQSRALIDYGYESTGEEPNAKTSIYNKRVLMTPGV